MNSFKLVLASAIFIFAAACGNRSVQRIDPNQQVDLSGRWNGTDSKLVSAEMISDVMRRPWHSDFRAEKGKKAVVIVGNILNKTTEHIDAETFIKDVEKEFVNSGQITLVQDAKFRAALREERAEQQENASAKTVKKFGEETGADFMLQGVITSIIDQYKNQKVVTYKINLELTNLESNEKVWIGDKEIKKYIKN